MFVFEHVDLSLPVVFSTQYCIFIFAVGFFVVLFLFTDSSCCVLILIINIVIVIVNKNTRGLASGVYMGIYPPPKEKPSTHVNFLWGTNDVRTAIPQFYTPKELLYPPKTNFWLRP